MRLCRDEYQGNPAAGFYDEAGVIPLGVAARAYGQAMGKPLDVPATDDLLAFLPTGESHAAAQLVDNWLRESTGNSRIGRSATRCRVHDHQRHLRSEVSPQSGTKATGPGQVFRLVAREMARQLLPVRTVCGLERRGPRSPAVGTSVAGQRAAAAAFQYRAADFSSFRSDRVYFEFRHARTGRPDFNRNPGGSREFDGDVPSARRSHRGLDPFDRDSRLTGRRQPRLSQRTSILPKRPV